MDPDFSLLYLLHGEFSSEQVRDPRIAKRVIDALDSNVIFAEARSRGLSFEDVHRYQDYAFTYKNEDGWTTCLPLSPSILDRRTTKYCECLSDLGLEEFWVDPKFPNEFRALGLPPLKDFPTEPLIKVTLRELLGFPRRRKPELPENQLEKSPWQ